MKKTFATLFVLALAAFSAFAQTYPTTSPAYIPNAVLAPKAYTAPAMVEFNVNGLGTLSLRVSGTCTSLAATMQASNDNGANYTAINMYPIAVGTTAPVPVGSISAVGFWKSNVTGFNKVRLNISALTATCTVAMVGTPYAFTAGSVSF